MLACMKSTAREMLPSSTTYSSRSALLYARPAGHEHWKPANARICTVSQRTEGHRWSPVTMPSVQKIVPVHGMHARL